LRLKRIGIDLAEQDHNRERAKIGSVTGEWATIDLSSASDSIATEFVRELLPPEWFELLNSTRSLNYLVNGNKTRFHKFCSMGNGFCFPLETLLFSAICHAAGAGEPGKDFLVYGDDIIVRTEHVEKLLHLLSYCGFTPNSKKTFYNGSFRESCGADWFAGEDVRPYTLDHKLDSVQNIFKFLNLSRRSFRTELFFREIRSSVLHMLPRNLRLFRPQRGPADSGIDMTGDEHLYAPHCRFNKNLQCWEYL